MLRNIRLLVFDLDYVVFDCAALKASALRKTLIPFADLIPQHVGLPDDIDIEEGFLEYGSHWIRSLDLGLDQSQLATLEADYLTQEARLLKAGGGHFFPGILHQLSIYREAGLSLALGAESTRDYLMSVSDRHNMDQVFEIAFCAEEYGMGGADEMLTEIMSHAAVNPSETLILGTRPPYFEAAHSLDLLCVGCGWGLHKREALAHADFQVYSIDHMQSLIQQADDLSAGYSS